MEHVPQFRRFIISPLSDSGHSHSPERSIAAVVTFLIVSPQSVPVVVNGTFDPLVDDKSSVT